MKPLKLSQLVADDFGGFGDGDVAGFFICKAAQADASDRGELAVCDPDAGLFEIAGARADFFEFV